MNEFPPSQITSKRCDELLFWEIYANWKQEHGVELRHLSAEPIQSDCAKVVYLVRSKLDLMKFICSNVHNDVSKGLQREYHVYFVPRRAVVCEKVNSCWLFIWLHNLTHEFNEFHNLTHMHLLYLFGHAGPWGWKGSSLDNYWGVPIVHNSIGWGCLIIWTRSCI